LQFLTGVSYSNSIFRGEEIPGTSGGYFNLFSTAEYEKVQRNSFGIPLELGASIKITNVLYIGLKIYGNINKDNILYMPMLSLSLNRKNTSLKGR
jgi:hypothetical protein